MWISLKTLVHPIGIRSTLSSREVLAILRLADCCLAPHFMNTFSDVESGLLCLSSKYVKFLNTPLEERVL